LHEFEEGFKQSIGKKSTIIRKFTSIQLEDLLRTSTKNVAQEVVSSLIPSSGGMGVLADIDKAFGGGRKHQASRKAEEDGSINATDADVSNRGSNVR
jgi:hypothetical protein